MNFRNKNFDLILLITISFILFYRSLNIYFLSDNIGHIEGAGLLLSSLQYETYFRPLWALSLIIDKFLWGANYSGYHLSNVMFHTVAVILVYLVAYKILQNRLFALVSGILFLIHPIHSHQIFWISGRTDAICAIFYLCSLIFFLSYIDSGKVKFQILSVLSFILSLLSKEMAVSLPVVIFSYVWIFADSDWKNRVLKGIRFCAPQFIVLISFLVFRILIAKEQSLANPFHANLNVLVMMKNLATYLGLLVVPGGHVAIANFLKANSELFIFIAAMSLIFLLVLLFWNRKSKLMMFSLLFILITLIPVIRLMMRWYLYIPSIGFCLAAAYVLTRSNKRKWGSRLSTGSLILLLFTYIGLIQLNQQRWLAAGELSNNISYRIADVISHQNRQEYLFLNLPAELREVPVMMFGAESLINFRLKHDFSVQYYIHIKILSHISLSDIRDFDEMRIEKTGQGVYELGLSGTESNFTFPHQAEIVSKIRYLNEGSILRNSYADIQVMGMNDADEVNQVMIEVHDKTIPVLYYEDGDIKIDEDL